MVATKNPRRKFLAALATAALIFQSGCTPPGPRALLRGDELLRDDKPAKAIDELKRATELMPNEPRAWNLLGVAYHRAGQPQPAIAAYRQALARDRSNVVAVAHYNLGCLLLEQNNAAGAADELRSYTLLTNSAAGFVKLGAAQSNLRQWDAAERTFNLARQLEPKNAEALNGIGVIHAQRSQRDAMQYFNSALQANPKYAPALLNSALLAQQNPATKSLALQRYREYLATRAPAAQSETIKSLVRQLETELAPPKPTNNLVTAANTATNPIAIPKPQLAAAKSNALAAVLKSNQVAAAVTNSNPPRTNPPPPPPVTVVSVTNEPPVKVASTEVALPNKTNPTVAQAPAPTPPANNLTEVSPAPPALAPEKKPGFFSRLNPFGGKPKSPTNEIPRAVVLNSIPSPPPAEGVQPVNVKPVFPRYAYASPARPAAGNRVAAEKAFRKGADEQRAGKTNEALIDYQLAVATDPSYFDAQYYAALLAFQSGYVKQALAGWETALAIESDSLNARYSFALVLKQAGYPFDAANELEKIIEAKPTDASAHLALGNLYAQQLNEPSKARAHYAKVLELDPRNPHAAAIRFWLAANP